MKTILFLSLVSLNAFAQNISSMQLDPSAFRDVSSQGFRVSVVKPILQLKQETTFENETTFREYDFGQTIGFSLGYAYLPIQSVGFTTHLTYLDTQRDGQYIGIGRFDLNLALAFNSFLNVKAGPNLSKFVNKDDNDLDQLDATLGYQGSIGIQLSENIGFDIGYVQMNQKGTLNDIELSFSQAGYEAALHATF